MQKPSKRLRRALERATANYEANLTSALSYLNARGITEVTAKEARLGFVASPEPGHEAYVGRVSIPYVDKLGVYALKFRCMGCDNDKCNKYLGPAGQETSVYGVLDADSTSNVVHITEGEFDRLIIKQVFTGDPAMGIPGAQSWKSHHPFHFSGFERVVMWADGDKAGEDFANRVMRSVRNVEVINMPPKMDVTDYYVAHGAQALIAMAGEEEDGD